MLETTAIVYFSGTGNTEAVAGFIENSIKRYFNVDAFKIEDITKRKVNFDLKKYHMIGIGYPIYGFNAPRIIFDFIEHLTVSKMIKAFVFSTCAAPLYFNDIASFKVKKLLVDKGFNVFYERQFYMPANIALKYNDEISKQLCNAAADKSKIMSEEISNSLVRIRRDKIGPMLISWLYAIEKSAWKRIPKDFLVLETCTKCKKCIQACPLDNISLSQDQISFGDNCLACYRCVYSCPVEAITGKKYKFAIFKDGYDIKQIINNDNLKGDFITVKTRGYYKIFRNYLFKE